MGPTRWFAIFLCLAALVSACTSGDQSIDVTPTSGPATTAALEPSTTTAKPVDTTEDLATTTTEPPPVAPLTGLIYDDKGVETRPALVVKIDNHPKARPQTGLDQADIVIEMRAEGVTRFAAVYQSTVPDPVGPVRSSRTSDFDLLRGFDRPLYSSSGGNDFVMRGLGTLPITAVTATSHTNYFRDRNRAAPHNLYTNSSELFALAPASAESPSSWFSYRSEGEVLTPSARPVSGAVTIGYPGGPIVTHTWDPTIEGWVRTQDGRPHTTRAGDQIAPDNVVIMVTRYVTSAADSTSPELVSVGEGEAIILTDGNVVTGRWTRPVAEAAPLITDSDGNVIKLTPGKTWLLYPESGNVLLPVS
jgi:hypothetical protein